MLPKLNNIKLALPQAEAFFRGLAGKLSGSSPAQQAGAMCVAGLEISARPSRDCP